jgi:small subunit ribosomal protein S6
LQTYETIFISPPDLSAQKLDDLVEKIKTMVTRPGGEIVSVEKWGRRRLAYPIRRHPEGFYVFITFKSPPEVLAELTQFYKVTDDVIRQIVCKAVRQKVLGKPRTGPPLPAGAVRPQPEAPVSPAPAAPQK